MPDFRARLREHFPAETARADLGAVVDYDRSDR